MATTKRTTKRSGTAAAKGQAQRKKQEQEPVPVPHLSVAERAAQGRAARSQASRSAQAAWQRTLSGAAARLMDQYHYADMARKVVGVGSVGTRCWIILMLGRDNRDPLFLQVKEATDSVLEPFAGKSRFANHGRRVVEGQWLMQSASDIMLGWVRVTGFDGPQRDFYVRQLWDWKRSADIDTLTHGELVRYGRICGWSLALGHARSGDPIAIAGYVGRGKTFEPALAAFADSYADRNEHDFKRFRAAAKAGEIKVESGL